jgi:tRNA(fMet)-specific endonuclease VapC
MIQGYLLDTNIIEYWRNNKRPEHAAVLNHLNQLSKKSPLRISFIVIGEISFGLQVAESENKVHPRAVLDFIKNEFPNPLPIQTSTTQIYGKLRAALFEKYAPKQGRKGLRPEQLKDPVTALSLGIQENDLWIASQALEYNLILVTNDKMSRLSSIESDLRIENWAS